MLHAYHQEKFLELELGDMKKHGDYRIIAVDNDLISFRDLSILSKDPVVLVTNPKDARYSIPYHEPLHRMRSSDHIRFLVFPNGNKRIVKVQVFLDGREHTEKARYVGGAPEDPSSDYTPLWVTRWFPYLYDDGKPHVLQVFAFDEDGRNGTHRFTFRLDGRQVAINGGTGEFILTSKVSYWVSD